MNLQDRFYGSQIRGVGKKFITAVSDENLLEAKDAVETGLYGKAGEVLSEESSLQSIAESIISGDFAARLDESAKSASKKEGWKEDEEEDEDEEMEEEVKDEEEEEEESEEEEMTEAMDPMKMMQFLMSMMMMSQLKPQHAAAMRGKGPADIDGNPVAPMPPMPPNTNAPTMGGRR